MATSKKAAAAKAVNPVVIELTAGALAADKAELRAIELEEALERGGDVIHCMTDSEVESVETDIKSVVGLTVKLRGANKTLAGNIDEILAYLPDSWIDFDSKSRMAGWRDVEAIRLLFFAACKKAEHSNASKAWGDVKKQSRHYVAPEVNNGEERAYTEFAKEILTALYCRGVRQELDNSAKEANVELGQHLVTFYKVDITKLDGGDIEEK